MKAFEQMWTSIGRQVTNTIFRLEENPGFVGSLWTITAATHAAPVDDYVPPPTEGGDSQAQAQAPSGEAASKAVDPIRNRGERVGRNDPCPCGSGKKFKNCHMK
jgi:preprotein translocase subunit SecA